MTTPCLSTASPAALPRQTAARPASPDRDLGVTVVADGAGLARIGDEWRALEALSPAAAVFQSHAQTEIWVRHFIEPGPRAPRLHIVVVRQAGAARLILPLALSRRAGLTIGHMVGAPIAQYAELLADPAADLPAIFGVALGALREDGVDALVFDGVRADSALLAGARPALRPPLNRRIAPFADLAATPSHDGFVRSRGKDLLYGIRNRRKRLERDGRVSFELIEGGAAARAAIGEAIGLKLDWLQQRGAVSSAFIDSRTTDCLLELAERCPGAVVMRLAFEDRPAAIRFGFEHGGTFFAYLSAYDTDLAQYAPGKLLLNFCFERERERRTRLVDMLPPAGEHKTLWCDSAVEVADYLLPLTGPGTLFALARERALPAAEWTWHHLPAGVRSLVARHILRS